MNTVALIRAAEWNGEHAIAAYNNSEYWLRRWESEPLPCFYDRFQRAKRDYKHFIKTHDELRRQVWVMEHGPRSRKH